MHRNYDSNSPIRFYAFSDHIEIQSPGDRSCLAAGCDKLLRLQRKKLSVMGTQVLYTLVGEAAFSSAVIFSQMVNDPSWKWETDHRVRSPQSFEDSLLPLIKETDSGYIFTRIRNTTSGVEPLIMDSFKKGQYPDATSRSPR